MATTDVILPSIQYDNVNFADATSTANLVFLNNTYATSGFPKLIYNNDICVVGFPGLETNVTILGCNVSVNVDSYGQKTATDTDTFMMTHLYKYFSLGEPKQTLTPNSSRYTKFPDEP